MKFNCDRLGDAIARWRYERKQRRHKKMMARYEWHTWFAWHPVKLAHGDCRWLETLERKRAVWRSQGLVVHAYNLYRLRK